MARMVSRRAFVGLGLGLAAALATGCGADRSPGAGDAARGNRGEVSFVNPLAVPPLETGEIAGEHRSHSLVMSSGTSEFLPGMPAPTWGFNQPYLGPTLLVRSGEQVHMRVRNDLPEASSVHWHGMRLPARMDGGPHQSIEPGQTWEPSWLVDQPAATLWYHPHPHGRTAQHVYRGLSGLIIVDDGQDHGLPSTYGVDDIPLILQDRVLGEDGTLREDQPVAIWGLMGNDILVNGTLGPRHEVSAATIRFRILNGANTRMFNLEFADQREFTVVGTDVGLLREPVRTSSVSISSGERVEILVDFTPGEEVLLRSRSGSAGVDDGEFDLLLLRAAATLPPAMQHPTVMATAPAPVQAPADARVRTFQLSGDTKINAKEMAMDRIDEVVPAGAIEIWEVDNIVFSHNFHIHDAAFTILSIDGQPPHPTQQGLKDTVFVPGYTKARLAVAFGHHTDPNTPYMYHCHMLTHEDKGMMGQFVIVEPGTEESTPRQLTLAPQDEHSQETDHPGHHG